MALSTAQVHAPEVPAARGAGLGCTRNTLVGSFHPSQQNTFTGKLTRPILRAVFLEARKLQEQLC